jgi:hypothetical protein
MSPIVREHEKTIIGSYTTTIIQEQKNQ